jgi:hypothetical protein
MYNSERETYYRHLLSIYTIPNDTIIGRYHGALVYIDTDSRVVYSTSGQAVMQFRH